jgi:hypothetical protein
VRSIAGIASAYTIAAMSAARFADQRTFSPAATNRANVANFSTASATNARYGSKSMRRRQTIQAKSHVAASMPK